MCTMQDLPTTNPDEWCAAFTFFARFSAYVGILALMVLVIFLIMKYIMDIGDDTNPLLPEKAMTFRYGTCDRDFEPGNGSGSSSSNNSSTELYDGKICIICYDEERNCFFVPCGHCATCYICAKTIFSGENKVCPICRRFISKVRKLFAS
ncbi:E3 ubiquitin-protein ligase APD2 [Jatropha curcas]|uniref:E3 ubiquitin-protein ligase APD2 n=1 Tax=Jatropha curcas TaxID=180498 RepID=UPI0005FBE6AA|nr:E3 ubiquitin-protein ligase APD2 [Jatropha curcas]